MRLGEQPLNSLVGDFDMGKIKELLFEPASFEGLPEDSVILKFPTMSITVFQGGKQVFAEVLKKSSRKTFKGVVADSDRQVSDAVEKVMQKLSQVVTITKRNK